MESSIFLPVMTSLPQVIPVRRTTQTVARSETPPLACLPDLLWEFEGSQNCRSFCANDVQVRTLLGLEWFLYWVSFELRWLWYGLCLAVYRLYRNVNYDGVQEVRNTFEVLQCMMG